MSFSYITHLESVSTAEKLLRTFYSSKDFKIARYRKEQEEKAEVGQAIAGILRVARKRAKKVKRKVVVAIGDGDFKEENGGVVKANKFVSKLYIQATGEGMLVRYVDELRTSISCCKYH
ncbi:hypothetical protein BGZ76_010379 [Entomortierella beljakovae]|nr:hypothetical protein BGZ76_010379 [Entomortierella beljakovae]